MTTDARQGIFTIDGETLTLAGSVHVHTRTDGVRTFEADVTGPDGEMHLVLVGPSAESALGQLGAA